MDRTSSRSAGRWRARIGTSRVPWYASRASPTPMRSCATLDLQPTRSRRSARKEPSRECERGGHGPSGRRRSPDRRGAVRGGRGVPRGAGLRVDQLRLGRERQPALLGRRHRGQAHRRTDRAADDALGVVPAPPLEPGSRRAADAAPGALRPEAALRPARGRDERQHDRVPHAGAAGRSPSDPPDPSVGQRAQDHQAGVRPLLGDRRRVPQPARRARRGRVVHGLRLPPGDFVTTHLTLDEVHDGDALPELAVEVTATTVVLGALAARDWRPMHHDHDFAVNRNGTQDIFLNTPNQAAWFERFVTDWSGPKGRLARMKFRMKGSVFPGDTMTMQGTVVGVGTDETGCGWADLTVSLAVDGVTKTDCSVRVALPTGPDDNPWARRGDQWRP